MSTATKKATRKADIRNRVIGIKQIVANLQAANAMQVVPEYDGIVKHGHLTAANASLFVEGNFQEKWTTYATGWRDPDLEGALEFLAPRVQTPEWFQYSQFNNIEEWFSDASEDDLRAIRADFATVEYTQSKAVAKTDNRGLRLIVDTDQVKGNPNWKRQAVEKLLRRLKRNKLRRAFALLSAAAVDTAKTWDTAADPDQDLIDQRIAAGDTVGIGFNRVAYGETAYSKRVRAFRSQNNAGSTASAMASMDQLAGLIGVDEARVIKARYQATASAKSQIVGNKVLAFYAEEGQSLEDPSNIKLCQSPCANGQDYQVYIREISTKLWEVVVENYDLILIPSILGVRQLTIS